MDARTYTHVNRVSTASFCLMKCSWISLISEDFIFGNSHIWYMWPCTMNWNIAPGHFSWSHLFFFSELFPWVKQFFEYWKVIVRLNWIKLPKSVLQTFIPVLLASTKLTQVQVPSLSLHIAYKDHDELKTNTEFSYFSHPWTQRCCCGCSSSQWYAPRNPWRTCPPPQCGRSVQAWHGPVLCLTAHGSPGWLHSRPWLWRCCRHGWSTRLLPCSCPGENRRNNDCIIRRIG